MHSYTPSIPVHGLLHQPSDSPWQARQLIYWLQLLMWSHVYMSVMGMECSSSDSLGMLNIISWFSCNTLNHRTRRVQSHPVRSRKESFTIRNHVPLAMFWQIESATFIESITTAYHSSKLCFRAFGVLYSSHPVAICLLLADASLCLLATLWLSSDSSPMATLFHKSPQSDWSSLSVDISC